MSHEGHQRHFAGGLVTSALPSTSDALLSRNKRRLGPIADIDVGADRTEARSRLLRQARSRGSAVSEKFRRGHRVAVHHLKHSTPECAHAPVPGSRKYQRHLRHTPNRKKLAALSFRSRISMSRMSRSTDMSAQPHTRLCTLVRSVSSLLTDEFTEWRTSLLLDPFELLQFERKAD
jgi:hypothetical protein